MRKTILFTIVLILYGCIQLYSQNNVVPIEQAKIYSTTRNGAPKGTYFKDINHILIHIRGLGSVFTKEIIMRFKSVRN